MQRLSVDSTDILSIGYDPKERLLEVEFKGNRVYQYSDVAPEIYEHFVRADSYGEYFYATINKQYRYKRVTDTVKASPSALVFVTSNPRKLRDLKHACDPLGIEVEARQLPVDEIQSHNPEEIALKKAKQAYKLAGGPVVVNDAFWNILALRGFPGAYMSYVTEWFKPEDFLALMANKSDRTVICTDTLVYYNGKHAKTFTETYTGKITEAPCGEGSSIAQVVLLDGQTKTVAELHAEDPPVTHIAHIWHDFSKWYHLQQRLGKV